MKETFIDIKGYSGNYKVSKQGNIKSVQRLVGTGNSVNLRKERILFQSTSKCGYKQVVLYLNKKPKTYLIHRLVALAFIPNPLNKRTVNHINGIKTDNRVENLEWSTHSENIIHSFNNGFSKSRKEVLQYTLDGVFIKSYESLVSASKEANVCKSGISACIRGVQKTSRGFIWKLRNEM